MTDRPPPPSPSPSPPPTPKRRRGWAVVAVIGLVGVVVWAVVDRSARDPDLPPASLELDDVRPALLTADDLGPDLDLSVATRDQQQASSTGVVEACGRTETTAEADGSYLSAIFAGGPGRMAVVHTITLRRAGDPSLAEAFSHESACRERELRFEDGTTSHETIDVHWIDGLGDRAYAREATTESSGQLRNTYTLVVVREGVVSSVAIDNDPDEGFQDDLAHDLAVVADRRIRASLAG